MPKASRAARNEYMRAWYRRNKATVAEKRKAPERLLARSDNRLMSDYGMTREEYDTLLKSQGGLCRLCENPERQPAGWYRPLAVDHCHETGTVRGLLCSPCNTALGRLGDTIDGLERTLKYLKGELQPTGV